MIFFEVFVQAISPTQHSVPMFEIPGCCHNTCGCKFFEGSIKCGTTFLENETQHLDSPLHTCFNDERYLGFWGWTVLTMKLCSSSYFMLILHSWWCRMLSSLAPAAQQPQTQPFSTFLWACPVQSGEKACKRVGKGMVG